MTKLNNSFIAIRNNPFLLFVISLMAFLAITFLIMPLTANAEEYTSTTDETNHMSIDNEPSVHNHQEQSDNDKINNETTSTEDESEDVTEQQETEDSTEEQDSVEVDEENNTSDIDESDSEDVNDSDENEGDSEYVEEEQEVGNEENIDTEPDEEEINTPESEKEKDVDASEEDEDKVKSDKEDKEKNSKTSNTNTLSSVKSNELKKGDRDTRVIQMKEDLAKLGFRVPGNGTNQFGPQTENKIIEFQKYYNLKVTGTLNSSTEKKLNDLINSPLQRGKKHSNTIKLKKDLKFLGMPVPGVGNSSYGPKTEQTVKKFQSKYGLIVNGIADEVTLNKIKQLINAPLSNGMRREDVITLKKDLAKLGFKVPGNGTNQFGPQTTKQVKAFQKYYGLSQTGIVNQTTINKLNSQINTPLQRGEKHSNTIKLKKDLKFLAMPVPGVGNSSYGPKTEQTVKKFQSKYGLIVNGIADEVTLNKIKQLINAPLSNGMQREDVITLKKDLAKLGFKVPGNGTNQFGPQTTKQVKAFQKYYGLSQTGIVNQTTINKLNSQINTPFQKGKRHNDTKQLKRNLNKIGFGGIQVTTLFSDFTEKRVKELQEYYGLKVSGIVDEVTQKKITSIVNSPFQNGKRHNDTKQLKRDLNKIGFGGIQVTTLFSDFTEKRVKELQEYYGLRVSGIVDEVTQKKITSIVNSPFQNGKRHNDTKQLKRDLNKIGFGGIQVTTLFSDFTERRVKEFQKHHKLRVSGIADEVTLKRIAEEVKKSSKKKIVYLDAGHGGSDPGASGNGLREKDLTLDIAKRTASKLRAAGFEVIMSRTTDKFLSLAQRTNEANKAKADIFVSIHINAGGGTGIETWRMSNAPKANESNALATHIQNETIKQTKMRDRGVKNGNLHVNRESKMPSALVEVGFIDTVADANKLNQASFLNLAATGIANGIKKFFN